MWSFPAQARPSGLHGLRAQPTKPDLADSANACPQPRKGHARSNGSEGRPGRKVRSCAAALSAFVFATNNRPLRTLGI